MIPVWTALFSGTYNNFDISYINISFLLFPSKALISYLWGKASLHAYHSRTSLSLCRPNPTLFPRERKHFIFYRIPSLPSFLINFKPQTDYSFILIYTFSATKKVSLSIFILSYIVYFVKTRDIVSANESDY